MVIAGGVIPPQDYDFLYEGVALYLVQVQLSLMQLKNDRNFIGTNF